MSRGETEKMLVEGAEDGTARKEGYFSVLQWKFHYCQLHSLFKCLV